MGRNRSMSEPSALKSTAGKPNPGASGDLLGEMARSGRATPLQRARYREATLRAVTRNSVLKADIERHGCPPALAEGARITL